MTVKNVVTVSLDEHGYGSMVTFDADSKAALEDFDYRLSNDDEQYGWYQIGDNVVTGDERYSQIFDYYFPDQTDPVVSEDFLKPLYPGMNTHDIITLHDETDKSYDYDAYDLSEWVIDPILDTAGKTGVRLNGVVVLASSDEEKDKNHTAYYVTIIRDGKLESTVRNAPSLGADGNVLLVVNDYLVTIELEPEE